MTRLIRLLLLLLSTIVFSSSQCCLAGDSAIAAHPFFAGADISAVPEMEKAGAVYRDAQNQPGDPMAILHAAGCNLFRIRLFVRPDPDPRHTGGAVQDVAYAIPLAKRIKALGCAFLLDLHYSDSWADPKTQTIPASFAGLHGAALERRVHDYTAGVLKSLGTAGVMPDIVQVGNEIRNGMLWPDARLWKAQGEKEDAQWQEFGRLLGAGCRAVREASTPSHPIRIMIHVDSGGRLAPTFFFERLSRTIPVDFDIIGLSFYPTWGDSMDTLAKNMADLIASYHKDVLIAETSYPWAEVQKKRSTLLWPQTPAGQTAFLKQLTEVVRSQPDGHGIGYVWWFPEAIPNRGFGIPRGGKEALFDASGKALPAAALMGEASKASAKSQP